METAEPSLPATERPSGEVGQDAATEAVDPCAPVEAQLRRALADLDNLRKRFDREVARERANERARVTEAWLPVIDNLELALDHAGGDPAALVEGVRLVREQAIAVAERLGYPRFDDVGKPFDPYRHEAVASIEGAGAPGTVIAAIRPGYGRDDTILRPADVVVAKAPA